MISPAGIVLKGSGFYKTDSRSASKSAVEGEGQEDTETKRVRGRHVVVELGDSSSRLVEHRGVVRSGDTRRSPRRSKSAWRGAQAEIGVFGGSGFYEFLDAVERPDALDTVRPAERARDDRRVGGRRVAFIPRHGRDHEFAPAAVPARANLWAMRMLGVRQIVGPCAAGSLSPDDASRRVRRARPARRPHVGPTRHVLRRGRRPPRLVRRPVLRGRCPSTRSRRANASGVRMHAGGTVVVIPGPRFSTRAESRWYRAQGWDVVNMTQYPEAYLARELGIHYAGIALVTDYDTGVEDDASRRARHPGAGVRFLRGERAGPFVNCCST